MSKERILYSDLLKCSHERLCDLLGINSEAVAAGRLTVDRSTMVDELLSSGRVIFEDEAKRAENSMLTAFMQSVENSTGATFAPLKNFR